MLRVGSGFYRLVEWVVRLAYVNLLWFFFIFVGLIIFGIGPSTAAMFAVLRKMIMGEEQIPVFKTFWNSYKKEFKKANILTIILLVVGYILYIDLHYFRMQEGTIFLLLSYAVIVLMFIFAVMAMYIYPIYVHYELKFYQYFRDSLLLALMHPFITVMMGVVLYIVYYIQITFPGLIPFFGASSYSLVMMFCAYQAFEKIEMAKAVQLEKEEEEEEAKKQEGQQQTE